MASPIVLFIRPGFLVLPDDVGLVVLDVNTAYQSGLGSPVHDLPVEVQRALVVVEECPSLDKLVERLAGAAVDRWIVRVSVRGQIDIRAAHVQEAVWVPSGQLRGLGPIDDIVGHCGHLGRQSGYGPYRPEGMKSHVVSLVKS